jgi:thymidylate synthase (FAD)
MTKQTDILNDSKYIPVLDHGFVGLIDSMGSDGAIVSAARVSYGDGTKTVNEDRGLIRYLVRHRHTSPIEMAEVKLHLKMPIFVMRQWVRHRTASLNEYSGRYSIMSDEMYLPTFEALQPQSRNNKQGRAGEFDGRTKEGISWLLNAAYETSYDTYEALVKAKSEQIDPNEVIWDAYSGDDPLLGDDYPGLARELSRVVLPLANYTELYWKQNLHNLLHLIKLRRDGHAQKEIRDYAEAVYTLIKPLYPLTIEAWEDYVWYGRHLSRMEIDVLAMLIESADLDDHLTKAVTAAGSEQAFSEKFGLSLRELREFRATWGL